MRISVKKAADLKGKGNARYFKEIWTLIKYICEMRRLGIFYTELAYNPAEAPYLKCGGEVSEKFRGI